MVAVVNNVLDNSKLSGRVVNSRRPVVVVHACLVDLVIVRWFQVRTVEVPKVLPTFEGFLKLRKVRDCFSFTDAPQKCR